MKQLIQVILLVLCLSLAVPQVSLAAQANMQAAAVATINVNSATAKELQSLPGVGQATAANIVTYRTEKGPFKTAEGLLKVKGVGKKTLEKIRNLISLE